MIDTVLFLALASPPPGTQPGNSMFGMLMPMILIFGIFYFMLIRPQQRKEKERRKMIEAVKPGDRILFSGGILGTVSNARDDTLVVKIADNVKVEVARGAVSQVLTGTGLERDASDRK